MDTITPIKRVIRGRKRKRSQPYGKTVKSMSAKLDDALREAVSERSMEVEPSGGANSYRKAMAHRHMIQSKVGRVRGPFKKMVKRKYGRRGLSAAALEIIDADKRRAMILDQMDPNKARGSTYSRNLYGDSWANSNATQRRERLLTGYKGRGDYASWKPFLQKWVPKGSLSAVGGYFGGGLGRAVGSAASSYLGWGKYKRKNYRGRGDYGGDAGGNQIMAGSTSTPLTVNASDDLSGDIYFSHREFLGNVTAKGGVGNISPFDIVTYPLNVGLTTTFPWLSQIANQFELYELQGCIFEYRPTSGELGATGTNSLGKVVMATNYDPDADAFGSTVQMENYDYANSCKPSEHMSHGIETANSQRATTMLYVRNGPSIKDRVFTDIGNFYIATEGLPITAGTTSNLGELWVTYRVKLSRAQLFTNILGNSVSQDDFVGASTGAGSQVSNTATYFASQPSVLSRYVIGTSTQYWKRNTNTIGGTLSSTAPISCYYDFPPNIVGGLYRFNVYGIYDGAAPAGPYVNTVTVSNGSLEYPVGIIDSGAVTTYGTSTNGFQSTAAGSRSFGGEFYVSVKAPGNTICNVFIAFNIAPGAAFHTVVRVTQVSTSILK
ncbi:MAG: putative capsid protein [Arizlama virus]|nr:MAG: putative capsid protein [Arizlama virus]